MGVSIIFSALPVYLGKGSTLPVLNKYYGGSMPLNIFMYFPRDFAGRKKKWNNLKDKYKVSIIYLRLKW